MLTFLFLDFLSKEKEKRGALRLFWSRKLPCRRFFWIALASVTDRTRNNLSPNVSRFIGEQVSAKLIPHSQSQMFHKRSSLRCMRCDMRQSVQRFLRVICCCSSKRRTNGTSSPENNMKRAGKCWIWKLSNSWGNMGSWKPREIHPAECIRSHFSCTVCRGAFWVMLHGLNTGKQNAPTARRREHSGMVGNGWGTWRGIFD